MIAVIADDFTGAAEIGGVALRHGLKVVIETRVTDDSGADVLIVATDTRSLPPAEARKQIKKITNDFLNLQPELLYKKTDSLLRGNVAEELLEQLAVTGKKSVLLIPANPHFKRTIKDGVYYHDGVPLKESTLANISKEKILTSEVRELIGEPYQGITHLVSKDEAFPSDGLVIGNTMTEDDLTYWAGLLSDDILPAGGSGFFSAILNARGANGSSDDDASLDFGNSCIYVCGSAFPLSRQSVGEARIAGSFVSTMPKNMFCEGADQQQLLHQWSAEIMEGMALKQKVIIAIDELNCNQKEGLASLIREKLADVVTRVMQKTRIDELLIEGGATAYSVVLRLGYKKLLPVKELARGVIRMKVEDDNGLHLTMKPGSYQWPSSIWNN